MFAIGVAFAGPLLDLVRVEGGGFHFVGDSSVGKTTTLLVAQSVWGLAVREKLINWSTTDTALEEAAEAHSDTLLCLDEFARLAPTAEEAARRARTISFMLGSGQGKRRSSRYGLKGHHHAEWRVLFLSTGETGLTATSKKAGARRLKGEEVRFVDLPAEVDKELGIFESVPKGRSSSADAVKALESACKKVYGVAGSGFLDEVVKDPEAVAAVAKKHMKEFLTKTDNAEGNSWEQRFAKRFALVYAALLLAREYEIIPWSKSEIGLAVKACYMDSVEASQTTGLAVREMFFDLQDRLSNKRRVVKENEIRNLDVKVVEDAFAFRTVKGGETIFAVKTDQLKELAGGKTMRSMLLRLLKESGYLLTYEDTTKFAKQFSIGGLPRARYYCLSKRILDATDI